MPVVQVPAAVADATRRSSVVWVEGDQEPQPVWQVWHEGRMYVVAGGLEQPLAVTSQAVVNVRAKDSRELVVRWVAAVDRVEPGTALWDEVVPLLHVRRLNAPDGEDQPSRWARASTVHRFTPTGQILPL